MATKFEITILGCSSAAPTSRRHPSSQLINIAEHYFLVDCGEATQIQLRRYHIRFQRINHIFISHLHGDHYLGLMGLLSSLHLLGRKKKMHVYCPNGLKEVIEIQLKFSATEFQYPVEWHELDSTSANLVYEDERITVTAFPLFHRIPCCGFLFREKPRPFSLNKKQLEHFAVPLTQMEKLKSGEDAVLADGTVVANSELTIGRPPSRSYAYCSDTCFNLSVVEAVKGVDLLYHEATFMDDMAERARLTFHSTARQAATVALDAGVKQLIIGHFSSRYIELEPLLHEAQEVFPDTHLALEGQHFTIPESDRLKKSGK